MNLLKDYLEYQGNQNMTGSRSAIMEAFRFGIIDDGEDWMEMFKDRNKSSHTYNEDVASYIVFNIYNFSYLLFLKLQKTFIMKL